MKKNSFTNTLFIAIFSFVSLNIICSCQKETDPWHYNQYVFLEQYLHEHSELVEGECHHLTFDFPAYGLNPSTGILEDIMGSVILDTSLIMILGTGASANGVASSGESSALDGIHDLPAEHLHFTITKIEPDGTAHFIYKDSAMILRPLKEWLHTSVEVIDCFDGNGDTIGKVKFTYNNRITNWGLLDKEAFVGADYFDE